jgi:hypothetical protein
MEDTGSVPSIPGPMGPSTPPDDLGPEEEKQVSEARKALIKTWLERIEESRKFWETKGVWKRIKENQQLAAHGASKEWCAAGSYVVPVLNRHIGQQVAQLYAKNPTVVFKRARKLHYKLWDGRSDSLKAAMDMAAMGDPNSMALVQEVLAGRQKDLMYERLGKTLEILWDYYVNEQACNFKQQLKLAVRRTKVCKVAWVKLGFQRMLEVRPEITAQIEDVSAKIAAIEVSLKRAADGKIDETSAEMEELKLNLADLQAQETLVVREGLLYDFPRADEVIVDKKCRHLKSLAGARFVAHKFDMDPDEVLATYEVDLKGQFTQYRDDGEKYSSGDNGKCMARVFEVYDKRDRMCFTICEGHDDYLEEPYGQKLKIERFFPFFALVFNEVESDDCIYPPSDIELGEHIQNEYNRSRESLRQHRIAARPYYVCSASVDETEKDKLANHGDHEIITIKALATGQKVADLIQAGPTAGIDPNLYEVEMHFTDMLRALGAHETAFGGTSDSTATESSIAQQNMDVTNASNVDDLDEMMGELAKASSQVMLTELSKETVIEIVGEGAVWPDFPETREEVAKDLYLDVQAGSSGRPNAAAELANLERAAPTLLQLPGISPEPLGKRYADLLNIDYEELVASGMPSITAMNAMMAKMGASLGAQPATGDTETDPASQGSEGADNAQGPQQNENEPGPQPAYPSPMVV